MIADSILKIINKFIPDEDAKLKAQVELENEFTKQLTLKSDIIQAEQSNGSGKWRPRLMYLCMFFVTCHFLMYDLIPYILFAFQIDNPVSLLEAPNNKEFWSFLKIGVGGYIGSRGVENAVSKFQEWRRK